MELKALIDNISTDKITGVDTNTIIGRNTAGNGDSEELSPSEVRAIFNVSDNAQANVGEEFTSTLKTKLDGVEVGAVKNYNNLNNKPTTITTAQSNNIAANTSKLASIPADATNDTVANTKIPKIVSADNAIPRFNGVGGEVQNSGVTIDDNNNILLAGNVTSGGFLRSDDGTYDILTTHIGDTSAIAVAGISLSKKNGLITATGYVRPGSAAAQNKYIINSSVGGTLIPAQFRPLDFVIFLIASPDSGILGMIAIRRDGTVQLKGQWGDAQVWTNVFGSYLSPVTS